MLPPVRTTFILLVGASLSAFGQYEFPFQNPELGVEERIDDLIAHLTIDEKIDCMSRAAAVPRLGVTGSRHIEGYHGVAQGGPSNWGKRNPTPTTQFPQAYGLGATWDPDLIRRVASQEAEEARYLMQSAKYNRAGIIIRAPNADIARDPRWGRTEEVYGEDPFLVATLATAFVEGLHGDDSRYWKTASLLKHFLANSNEDLRFSSSSDLDERLWREYYAKGFEVPIVKGGANAMMAAYNSVNGTPAHVHPMLRDIVMGEWGLDGIICTDGGGLRLLVTEHKAFPDLATAAAACVKAGINNFLDRHTEAVNEALERGLLTEADIDAALRGLFRVDIKLGLLDPPEMVPYSTIGADGDPEPWDEPETRAFVREVTRKSIVLLKNSAGVLPLDRTKVKSIGVVGPYANTVLLDWYSGSPPYAISPRDGIETVANPTFFGPNPINTTWVGDLSDVALDLVRRSDVAVVVVGNHPESNAGWEIMTSASDGKEGVDRKEITLNSDQAEFIKKACEANTNTIVVLAANFPFAMPWVAEHAPAIVQITHASQEQGNALADVLFGEYNPGGKLTQTWPKSLDQLPPMMDYNIRNGRTYMYFKGEPQYPFGYGLSYTTFELSNLRTASKSVKADGQVVVSVDVKNTGDRLGDEVVQVYAHFPKSKVERPAKQLKGFKRMTVDAGETQTANIAIDAADLAYWNVEEHCWTVETGPVELLVGNSSADADLMLSTTTTITE